MDEIKPVWHFPGHNILTKMGLLSAWLLQFSIFEMKTMIVETRWFSLKHPVEIF